MNSITENCYKFFQSIVEQTSQFDETTWGILATTTVILGYFLLRGNSIRAH